MNRKGEKIGWIGGFAGGSLFLPALGGALLWKGAVFPGICLFLSYFIICLLTWRITPWRYPATPYRVLLAPYYAVLISASLYTIYAFHQAFNAPVQWRYALYLIPMFIPLITIGGKTWDSPSQK